MWWCEMNCVALNYFKGNNLHFRRSDLRKNNSFATYPSSLLYEAHEIIVCGKYKKNMLKPHCFLDFLPCCLRLMELMPCIMYFMYVFFFGVIIEKKNTRSFESTDLLRSKLSSAMETTQFYFETVHAILCQSLNSFYVLVVNNKLFKYMHSTRMQIHSIWISK